MPKSDKFLCPNCENARNGGRERYWFLCMQCNRGVFDTKDKVAVQHHIEEMKNLLGYPKCFERAKARFQ